MKAWESKNGQRAVRGSGLGLMAVTLAACGGSSSTTTTTPTTPVVDAPKALAFVKDVIDNLIGGSGNDTFVGDAATITAAGAVDGGAGTDTLRIFGTLTLPQVTNVENLYVNGIIGDVSYAATGFASIEIDGAVTTAAAANGGAGGEETITLKAGQTLILDSVTDGDGDDTDSGDGDIEIATAASVTSVAVVVDQVGISTEALDIDVLGTGVVTLNLTSSSTDGAATDVNFLGVRNTGAAIETVNVSGSTMLDATALALTSVTKIDASASTGGVKFNTTGSTADLTFVGGSGNDTLTIGANIDTDDKLAGGAGVDTLIVSVASLTSATAAEVKGVNAATGFERVLSNASGSQTIDASKITSVSAVGTAGTTGTGGAAANADASAGLTVTGLAAGSIVVIAGSVTGGATAQTSSDAAGGDGIVLATAVNSGADAVSMLFTAASTVTGGASESDTDDAATAHAAGDGLDASTVETITITTADKDADVAFVGGSNAADATNDTAGASFKIGANGTVVLIGAGDVNLGTVVSAAGSAADDLTIDGSAMTGKLTVTTGIGDDVIKGGSGVDAITAGTGANTVTTGGGSDTVTIAAGGSLLTAMTKITDFSAGAGGDKIDIAGVTVTFEALTSANATAIAADTSLSDAVTQAFTQLADDEATAFVFGGKVYVVVDTGGTAGQYDTANDVVVELSNLTSAATLHTDNVI